MYFILSKPDDCFLLEYGHGLVLNHMHTLSLRVILFFIASSVSTSCLSWMPIWKSQLKSLEVPLTSVQFYPRGAHMSHCIMKNSNENYNVSAFFIFFTTWKYDTWYCSLVLKYIMTAKGYACMSHCNVIPTQNWEKLWWFTQQVCHKHIPFHDVHLDRIVLQLITSWWHTLSKKRL